MAVKWIVVLSCPCISVHLVRLTKSCAFSQLHLIKQCVEYYYWTVIWQQILLTIVTQQVTSRYFLILFQSVIELSPRGSLSLAHSGVSLHLSTSPYSGYFLPSMPPPSLCSAFLLPLLSPPVPLSSSFSSTIQSILTIMHPPWLSLLHPPSIWYVLSTSSAWSVRATSSFSIWSVLAISSSSSSSCQCFTLFLHLVSVLPPPLPVLLVLPPPLLISAVISFQLMSVRQHPTELPLRLSRVFECKIWSKSSFYYFCILFFLFGIKASSEMAISIDTKLLFALHLVIGSVSHHHYVDMDIFMQTKMCVCMDILCLWMKRDCCIFKMLLIGTTGSFFQKFYIFIWYLIFKFSYRELRLKLAGFLWLGIYEQMLPLKFGKLHLKEIVFV